jgi:hypothetical protein
MCNGSICTRVGCICTNRSFEAALYVSLGRPGGERYEDGQIAIYDRFPAHLDPLNVVGTLNIQIGQMNRWGQVFSTTVYTQGAVTSSFAIPNLSVTHADRVSVRDLRKVSIALSRENYCSTASLEIRARLLTSRLGPR